MKDNFAEVRDAGSKTLVSIITSANLSAKRIRKMQKRYMKLAKKKISKKSNDSLLLRHSGVLGLSAFVTSHPYDVPDFLPSILAYLARNHMGDPTAIKGPLKRLFAEFKRTHKDEWYVVQEKASEEDLEAINDVEIG